MRSCSGAGNGVQHVRRGDEQHLRQVVLHVEIVVLEGGVLLRVQHLQQRRRRIAAEVRGHLVDLIQHEDRVLRSGLLHRLDNLSRQRADVGAAMAANLGLVAHAAQRHAHELAARRLGNRHAQRGLADARRPDEAENRALRILHQLPHGEKFKNAFLDFLQAVVVRVQDLLRVLDGANLLRSLLPRHCQQPVEIVARDGRLGRHRRHRLELFQLLHRLLKHILRHAGGFDLLLQLVELATSRRGPVPSGWP